MDDAAVVPNHKVAVVPFVAVFVFFLGRVLHQLGDEVESLLVLHADDRFDAHRIEVKRLAAVFGMGTDEWMHPRRRRTPRTVFAQRPQCAWAIFAQINMHRPEPIDPFFGRRRQIVIGFVHVDVLRITAQLGNEIGNSIVALGGEG